MSKTILKIFLISCLLCNLAYGQDVNKISFLALNQTRDAKNSDAIIYSYNNQTLEGYYQIYAEVESNIFFEGQFKNGKREGLHISYSSSTKMVNSEITYREGKRNGTVKFFFLNGELQSDGKYKNGLADGMYREYSNKGILINEIKFKGGRRLWQKGYYENGQKSFIDKFSSDRREATSVLYYENGKLLKSMRYKDGGLIREKCYDEKGSLLKPDPMNE